MERKGVMVLHELLVGGYVLGMCPNPECGAVQLKPTKECEECGQPLVWSVEDPNGT